MAIQHLALEKGLIDRLTSICAVTTAEYGRAALRPPYSVLDASDLWLAIAKKGELWRDALEGTISEVLTDNNLGWTNQQ